MKHGIGYYTILWEEGEWHAFQAGHPGVEGIAKSPVKALKLLRKEIKRHG